MLGLLVEIVVKSVFVTLEHGKLNASVAPQVIEAVEILYGHLVVRSNVPV
jgi:hypothetical protein